MSGWRIFGMLLAALFGGIFTAWMADAMGETSSDGGAWVAAALGGVAFAGTFILLTGGIE